MLKHDTCDRYEVTFNRSCCSEIIGFSSAYGWMRIECKHAKGIARTWPILWCNIELETANMNGMSAYEWHHLYLISYNRVSVWR